MQRLCRQRAQRPHFATQRHQLTRVRQPAAPQQVCRLLECDLAGERLELVAADDELARESVDVTQTGLGGDDAVEAAGCGLYRCVDETAFTS